MFSILLMFLACSSESTPTQSQQTPPAKAKETAATKSKATNSNKAVPQQSPVKFTDFGAPFKLKSTMPAADFLASPEKFVDRTVRVEGKVTAVCQKMGCWLVITDNEKSMRITTKGHNFLVDKEGTGSLCQVEGKVISRDKSPARTAHFESETSKGAPVPEKQAKGEKVIEIVASSVRFFPKSK